jgi:hypothetical protein
LVRRDRSRRDERPQQKWVPPAQERARLHAHCVISADTPRPRATRPPRLAPSANAHVGVAEAHRAARPCLGSAFRARVAEQPAQPRRTDPVDRRRDDVIPRSTCLPCLGPVAP